MTTLLEVDRRLRWSWVALAAVGWVTLTLGGAFVVVDLVVPGWLVALVLLAAASITRRAARRVRPEDRGERASPGDRLLQSSWTTLVLVLGLLAAGASAAYSAAVDRTYTVLDPPSPAGCRVVVVEEFFLLDGRAGVHVTGPVLGWVPGPDDPLTDYRPYSERGAALSWRLGEPSLTVDSGPVFVPDSC